jgi:hypothetical protein
VKKKPVSKGLISLVGKEILSGKNLGVPTSPDAVPFADSPAVRLSAKIVFCRQPNTAVGKALSFFLNFGFKLFMLPNYIVYKHMFQFGPFL